MKIKILVTIATLLIVMLITVRYIYRKKFEQFKINVKNYELMQLEKFQKEKEIRIVDYSNGDKNILQLFNQQYDENKSISENDTSFSFLYLNGKVKYKSASLKYINCLYNKCVIDDRNKKSQKLISAKEKNLELKFGEAFPHWYSKLKDEKLLLKRKQLEDCGQFFLEVSEISFNPNIWSDFEKFLTIYTSEIKDSKMNNQQTENEYADHVFFTKSQLNSEADNYFENLLSNKKSKIISNQSEAKSHNSPTLGLITYNINRTIFDKQAYQEVENDAIEEHWKHNSLRTGEMPYLTCFGSNNFCGDINCSQIKVITGGTGDVLVSLKNNFGQVVRHAYINGGYSYTFDIPDGSYQVFFYSGSGWNPNKIMPSSTCNSLRGGFVTNENVTKDNYITLLSQIMTYELILQQDGNFRSKPSTKNEAF